jgi:hypothetical protein
MIRFASMAFPGFERVASFASVAEAEVVRGLLAASAIEARVAGTSHLAREHFPSGEMAVLVPEAEVARAREIIASARAPDDGRSPARPATRPVPVLSKVVVAVGLALVAGGAVPFFAPAAGEPSPALLVAGLVLAALGLLAGRGERRARVRSVD